MAENKDSGTLGVRVDLSELKEFDKNNRNAILKSLP